MKQLIRFFSMFLLFNYSEQQFSIFTPNLMNQKFSYPQTPIHLANVTQQTNIILGRIPTNRFLLNITSNFNIENVTRFFTLTTKCFEDLGCITSDAFFDTLKTLPLRFTDPQELNVTFNLFTRLNQNRPQVFTYKPNDTEFINSSFNPNHPTKFIIHGYMSGFKDDNWMSEIKNYLLNDSDYNVFAIDWSNGADSVNYFQSAVDTRVVGAMVSHFIKRLINFTNAKPNDIDCIGHSLGAHTCGFIGQRLQNNKLAKIFGLDPAGPGFLLNDAATRLDKNDANLVVVLHTNAGVFNSEGTIGTMPVEVTGLLGNNNPLGHFDFWPNGGSKQPGCGVIDKIINLRNTPKDILNAPTCNHERAHIYPKSAKQSNCQFIGYQCKSYAEFKEGKCADCGDDHQKCKPMELGLNFWDQFNNTQLSSKTPLNYFYLETNESQPFCLFHYQIMVQISRNSSPLARGQLEISLNNGKKVSISRSLTGWETGLDLRFEASHNYTKLYLDSNELKPSMYVTLKWSSLLRNTLTVDRISINFMSNLDDRVRRNKSILYCDNSNTLSNGESVVFQRCPLN